MNLKKSDPVNGKLETREISPHPEGSGFLRNDRIRV